MRTSSTLRVLWVRTAFKCVALVQSWWSAVAEVRGNAGLAASWWHMETDSPASFRGLAPALLHVVDWLRYLAARAGDAASDVTITSY